MKIYTDESDRTQVELELIKNIWYVNNALIERLQIKPSYLNSKKTEQYLSLMIRSYKDIQHCELSYMYELDKTFNVEEFILELEQTMLYNTASEQQFIYSQQFILNHYKQDVIKQLTQKLDSKKITYDEFQSKIDKIKQITISSSDEKKLKTINEIDLTYEEKQYIKSNCTQLDKYIRGFILGELSVWSGSNASAKSTYLNQLALECINQNKNVAIFSGELTAKRLLNWLLLQASGKNNLEYNSLTDTYYVKKDVKQKILNWLNNKLFIYDNENGNDARSILDAVSKCIDKNDIKMVIIDNLMAMNLSKYGDAKYDMQTNLITELSALAKQKNVHIHFVCHPRKSTSFLRKNDISGTADLTNIADNVFIMHRVNNDFKKLTKEMFNWKESEEIYKFSNVIEICKNREFGVQDKMIGLYFENESKRLLNEVDEDKKYSWEV